MIGLKISEASRPIKVCFVATAVKYAVVVMTVMNTPMFEQNFA